MTDTNPLVGHKKAQQTIIKLIEENKLPHAILIHGAKGIGKAKFAKELAFMLICGQNTAFSKDKFSYNINSPEFKRIEAGSLKEFNVISPIEGKKQISVEQIRDSIQDLSLVSEKKRVIIIDTADQLNQNSANAILKTLEEPPSNTLLILISNSPAKLLPTINSRCRKIKLEPLTLNQVEQILEQENLSSENIEQALQFSAGSVYKAIQFLTTGNSILDKLNIFFEIENPKACDIISISETLSDKKLDESLVYSQLKDIISGACKKSVGAFSELENIKAVQILSNRFSYQELSLIYDKIVETEIFRNSINLTQTSCFENIFRQFKLK